MARLVDPARGEEDLKLAPLVMPSSFDEFIGQEAVKRRLTYVLTGARRRGEMPEHILFLGGPGLGKSTLAKLVAKDIGADFKDFLASGITAKNLPIILTLGGTKPRIIFLDELHDLKRSLEADVRVAMEERRVWTGSRWQDLGAFTLLAATYTHFNLPQAFLDRFSISLHLEPYTVDELVAIILQAGRKLGFSLSEEVARAIAMRSRNTARIAVRLTKRIRDFNGDLSLKQVEEAFDILGIDIYGLDDFDRQYLKLLCEATQRGIAIGLNNAATILGVPATFLSNTIEPYLIRSGLMERLPQGRKATHKGLEWYDMKGGKS